MGLCVNEDTEWEAEGESWPEDCEPEPPEGEPGAYGEAEVAPNFTGIFAAGDICGYQDKMAWYNMMTTR